MNAGYRHEALLWHGPEEYLAATVPFVRDGLEQGQVVMVAAPQDHLGWLRDALGGDADDVTFMDMLELGRNPAQILPAWRGLLDERSTDVRGVRGIGEPVWPGRRAEELVETQLHEALLNVAFEPDTPFWLLCPYDVDALPADVIEEAYRSHPAVISEARYRGSHLYGGRDHVDEVFGSPLPRLSGKMAEMTFDRDDLHQVSCFVATRAYAAGVSADKAANLAVAVHELAAGSVQRGAVSGTVRVHTLAGSVVCEVHDETVVKDPMTGRRGPRSTQGGLAEAHRLTDLVQLRSTPDGTTVRVHHWL